LAPPLVAEVRRLLTEHLAEHLGLYGEYTGVRSARKHLGWYARSLPVDPAAAEAFRQRINVIERCEDQLACVREFFETTPFEPWKLAA
jgi:tRNA-dihydrouridine synthase B